MFHVKRWARQSLSNAKVAEDYVQNVFHVDPAREPAKRPCRQSQFLGDELLLTDRQRALQGIDDLMQRRAMALTRDQGRFSAGEQLCGEISQGTRKAVQAEPR